MKIMGADVSETFEASLSTIIIWISFFISMVSTFLIVVTSGITLRILMLFLPFVLICKVYKIGDQMLNQWISAFVSNLLVVFFVASLFHIVSKEYSTFISQLTTNFKDITPFSIAIDILLVSILFAIIIKLGTGIAKELGNVSIEGIGAGIGNATQKAAGGAAAGAFSGAASSIGKAGIAMSAATGPAGVAMAGLKGLGAATGSAAFGAVKGGLKASFGKK